MIKKKPLICMSVAMAVTVLSANVVLASALTIRGKAAAGNTIPLMGTDTAKPESNSTAYTTKTSGGTTTILGTKVKADNLYVMAYNGDAVTGKYEAEDNKTADTGNADYVTAAATAPLALPKETQAAEGTIKLDNKVVSLTGTVVTKPTNDGTAYILNTNEGSYYIIGQNVKSLSAYVGTDNKITVTGKLAVGVKMIVMIGFTEYAPAVPQQQNNTAGTENTGSQTPKTAIKIDAKVISLTGTVVSKPTNDGTAYILNTNDGDYAIIGPKAKSISAYANTDKKVTVTGNPAVGVKILVMISFNEYVPEVLQEPGKATEGTENSATQGTKTVYRIDNKVISLTGTVVSKPTNDGTAYVLNTSDGSYFIIGPNARSISTYANTDKKVTVTGNPAIGINVFIMTSFAEYVPAAN